jgi:hypothetical protein
MNITNIVPVGTTVPFEQHNGNVGHWVESMIENSGLAINRGRGVDIPQLDKEVKTKNNESKSPYSIATMTVSEIIHTQYVDSLVYQKMQNHFTVEYNNSLRVVTKEDNIDFTDLSIQKLIKDAYEQARIIIAKNWSCGDIAPYVNVTEYGQFEKVPNQDSYRFRIKVKAMNSLKGMSKSAAQFDKLFEIVDNPKK